MNIFNLRSQISFWARKVWLRCYGIPINMWNDDYFTKLTKTFANYLACLYETKEMSCVEYARILIQTSAQ